MRSGSEGRCRFNRAVEELLPHMMLYIISAITRADWCEGADANRRGDFRPHPAAERPRSATCWHPLTSEFGFPATRPLCSPPGFLRIDGRAAACIGIEMLWPAGVGSLQPSVNRHNLQCETPRGREAEGTRFLTCSRPGTGQVSHVSRA